jgi:hypothetical protein
MVENIGGEFTSIPIISGEFSIEQLENNWWEIENDYSKATQYGRIGFKFSKPDYSNEMPLKSFTEPVLFSINDKKLISIPDNTWDNQKFPYIYNDAVVNILGSSEIPGPEYQFQIAGIDLFGQKSNVLTSNKLKLSDKIPQPSPQFLKIISQGTQHKLQFEYGANQYLQAPDVTKFWIHKKVEPLVFKFEAKYEILNVYSLITGDQKITLRINGVVLTPSVAYKLDFIHKNSNVFLPAKDRNHFIAKATKSNELVLNVPFNITLPASGPITIKMFPNEESNWSSFSKMEVKAKKPYILSLQNAYCYLYGITQPNPQIGLDVKILAFRYSENEKDLEGNPISTVPDEQIYTELYIDRWLGDANLFNGGKLISGTQIYTIWYQTAGSIYNNSNLSDAKNRNKFAKIVVKGDLRTVLLNQIFALIPPILMQDSRNDEDTPTEVLAFDGINKFGGLVVLKIAATVPNTVYGGEILLWGIHKLALENESNIPSDIEQPKRIISKVLSNIGNSDLLVRIDKPISHLIYSGEFSFSDGEIMHISNKIAYFEPYEGNISLEIPNNTEAFKNNYFAVSSEDIKGNKGGLSKPVQKQMLLEGPPSAPEPPFVCDDDLQRQPSYFNDTTKDGLASVKLTWPISEGNKYNIYRAADSSVVENHKKLWWEGKVDLPLDVLVQSIEMSSAVVVWDSSKKIGTTSIPLSFLFSKF